MNKLDKRKLPPSAVVLDLVFKWSESIGTAGTAKVVHDGSSYVLLIFARNHQDAFVSLYTPIHFDGEPSEEEPPRWVLRRLGPGVWKLAPSIFADQLHAYITVIDVPEPAPWERQGSHGGGP